MESAHQAFQQHQHKPFDIKEEIAIIKEEDVQQEQQIFAEQNIPIEMDVKSITANEDFENVVKNPLENEQFYSDAHLDEEDFDIEHNSNNSTSDEYEGSENSENEDIVNEEKSEENVNEKVVKKKTKRKDVNKSNNKEDAPKKKRSSHRLDPILTEQLIKKHIPMLCDLCVYTGETFSDIVSHFKEHHTDVQPYIMCCNRKFTRSYCIDQHAIIHENPDSFR